jgi:hypothetical protein
MRKLTTITLKALATICGVGVALGVVVIVLALSAPTGSALGQAVPFLKYTDQGGARCFYWDGAQSALSCVSLAHLKTPEPATPVPPTAGPSATATVTSTPTRIPSATPSATLLPTNTATAPPASAMYIANGGFETDFAWTDYYRSGNTTANYEDKRAPQFAEIVLEGNRSKRFVRTVFPAGEGLPIPILYAGSRNTIRAVPANQYITLSCSAWGVAISPNPYSNFVNGIEFGNQIGLINSLFRVGISTAGSTDPNNAQVIWSSATLAAKWTTSEVRALTVGGDLPMFVEVRVGQEWAPFPFAAAIIDNCQVFQR